MIEGSCHCGALTWRLNATPEYATSCNCTLCRRWGALWAYGFRSEDFIVAGHARVYTREPHSIEFQFCTACGCVGYWCTPEAGEDGRYYGAVNLRLADPVAVAAVPVNYFDGLDSFESRPGDGRCLADVLWG